MNYTHLLNERAFSTLSSAYRTQERELITVSSKVCYRRQQAYILAHLKVPTAVPKHPLPIQALF